MAKENNQQQPIKGNTKTGGWAVTTKLALFLGIIAFIVYANTLLNGYALDDFIVIKNNTLVTQGFSAIPELLATPYHRGHSIMANDLYRPLTMAMFAVEYQLFGGGPAGSHFINILIFCGCVILLFLFLDALFDRKKTTAAFIAALLFALHPIHTEVVANIKSRDELLCFLLSFGALLLFIKYARSGAVRQLAIGLGLFFLALLSKETAITFLAVVPLIFFFYQDSDKKRSWVITGGTAAVAIAYLAIRFSVLSKYSANNSTDVSFIDNILAGAPGASVKMATAISILGNYLRLLLIPYPLVCDYSYSSIPFVGWGSTGTIVSLLAYLALAIMGLTLLMKSKRQPLAFGLLFFIITIALFSNIPFLIGAAMAERFVFFASVGFCWVAALAIDKWLVAPGGNVVASLKSVKVLAVLVPVCLLYSIMCVARNGNWKDNTTLFKTDVAKTPGNSRMHYYLGTDYLISSEGETNDITVKQQMAIEGLAHLKKALAIYPGFALVNSEIGNAYFNLKIFDSSQVYYEKALAQNPKDTLAIHNLSAAYYFLKKYPESVIQCRAAVAIDLNYGRGYRNMGSCYLRMGKYDSAIVALRAAISIDPGINSSYQNIAYSFKLSGNMDSARKYEAIARQRNPAFSLDAGAAQ